MGFLSRSEPVAVDSALEKVVINENDRGLRKTIKLLSKNQLTIQANVEPDENIAAILGHGGWDPEIFDHVLVITNRRLLNFKKGRLDGSLQQSDVGRTRLFNQPNHGFLVAVETREGMMYADDDMRHFDASRYMAVQVDEPQLARGVCSIVDAINGLGE